MPNFIFGGVSKCVEISLTNEALFAIYRVTHFYLFKKCLYRIHW